MPSITGYGPARCGPVERYSSPTSKRVLTWAKVRQQTVYVLPTRTPQLYTGELRRQASYVVWSGLRPPGLDADVELPLLESLVAYMSDVALGATKSADLSRRPIAG